LQDDQQSGERKGKRHAVRSCLSSIKPAVVLIVLIVLAAGFGTIVPSLDIYHSHGFSLLLGLFSLNLIVCSLQRFPGSWKRFHARTAAGHPGMFKGISPDRVLVVAGDAASEAANVEKYMRKRYGRVLKEEKTEGTFLSGEKGAFSHFGVYIVHFGVFAVMAGALIGALFGFTATVNIAEGEAVDAVRARGEKRDVRLGFEVRLDRFSLDVYDNGMPKTYRSDLTFLKGGRILFQGPLLVNHPISLGGLRFYQASYGTAGGGEALLLIRKGGEETLRRVKAGALKQVDSRYFSGLLVTRDPGAPVVAAGAFMMMAGFMVVFFTSHRRLWVRIDRAGGKTRVAVTGAGKDPRGLERDIRHFLNSVKEETGKGKEMA